MGFRIPCPNCGLRDAYEFVFFRESKISPSPNATLKELRHYFYFNKNVAGVHEESWYHGACDSWLVVRRDTKSNIVIETRRLTEEL
jgi:methylglutamate dehydrogenase subunit B